MTRKDRPEGRPQLDTRQSNGRRETVPNCVIAATLSFKSRDREVRDEIAGSQRALDRARIIEERDLCCAGAGEGTDRIEQVAAGLQMVVCGLPDNLRAPFLRRVAQDWKDLPDVRKAVELAWQRRPF